MSSLYVQVLQYKETEGAWSKIGTMEKARSNHAVVGVDASCPGMVGQRNKKQLSSSPSPPPILGPRGPLVEPSMSTRLASIFDEFIDKL